MDIWTVVRTLNFRHTFCWPIARPKHSLLMIHTADLEQNPTPTLDLVLHFVFLRLFKSLRRANIVKHFIILLDWLWQTHDKVLKCFLSQSVAIVVSAAHVSIVQCLSWAMTRVARRGGVMKSSCFQRRQRRLLCTLPAPVYCEWLSLCFHPEHSGTQWASREWSTIKSRNFRTVSSERRTLVIIISLILMVETLLCFRQHR